MVLGKKMVVLLQEERLVFELDVQERGAGTNISLMVGLLLLRFSRVGRCMVKRVTVILIYERP